MVLVGRFNAPGSILNNIFKIVLQALLNDVEILEVSNLLWKKQR